MNWSRETLNANFSHVKCSLPSINERVFCIVQSLVIKNGSTTITQRRGNHGDYLAILQHRRIFMEKNSCCVFDGISLVSCIMSCSNRTRPLLRLSTEHNWWDWAEYSRKNAPATTPGKIILLHDNAWPHVAAPVKTYLETLKWEVLPHSLYSSDITPSDYHFFRSTTHDLYFTSYEGTKIISMIG